MRTLLPFAVSVPTLAVVLGVAACGSKSSGPTGSGGGGPTGAGDCGAGNLCLDVKPMRAGTTARAGRLVVVWAQLDDDGPDPAPKLGYSAAFAGTEATVAIPLAAVTPPDEPNLLCERSCNDEAICPCLSDPKIGLGYVAVLPSDDPSHLEGAVGIARMAVAYSAQGYRPAPSKPPSAYPFDVLFPDGVEAGVFGYGLARPEGGVFDRLSAGAAATGHFELDVCDADEADACTLSFPNLS